MSEEITVTRPSFWALADDLAAYTETLAMIEADLQQPHDPTEIETLRRDEDLCRADIARLGEALVKKTDNLAGVIRRLQSDAAIQREEAERMAARAKASERAEQWLKDYAIRVMDEHGWKHLKTVANTISIRGNGGVQPLVIDAPDKVPDDLCWMEGRIRADLWAAILDSDTFRTTIRVQLTRVPSNTLIREAIAKADECKKCGGVGRYCSECGDVPCSCRDTGGPIDMPTSCEACNGTGRAIVPGAHLESRGRHLRLS